MTNPNHECKFEEIIIEMHGDIKSIKTEIDWLVKDNKNRNHIMENHVKESDIFRGRVNRNTAWRHAFKMAIIAGFGCISALWLYFFNHISNTTGG